MRAQPLRLGHQNYKRMLRALLACAWAHASALASPSSPKDSRRDKLPLSYSDRYRALGQQSLACTAVAFVRSPYKERFGTPRQPTVDTQVLGGAAQEAMLMLAPHIARETLRGLEGFDFCWAIAWMHLNSGWKPLIRPPRGPVRFLCELSELSDS